MAKPEYTPDNVVRTVTEKQAGITSANKSFSTVFEVLPRCWEGSFPIARIDITG